jgi:hypothetical protein
VATTRPGQGDVEHSAAAVFGSPNCGLPEYLNELLTNPPDRSPQNSGSFYLQHEVDVSSRRMTVRADFVMRFLN